MPINLHPPLAAFPIALIVVVVLLEVVQFLWPRLNLHLTIRVNLILAALGTAAAFFSGYQASELANQTFTIADDLIAEHHRWGRLLLFIVVPCAMLQILGSIAQYGKCWFRVAYYLFLLACMVLVLVTGWLGGGLVFEHGAGVRAQVPESSTKSALP